MQPTLRNCQLETLECQMLLLNWPIEVKVQRAPKHEAKTSASKEKYIVQQVSNTPSSAIPF